MKVTPFWILLLVAFGVPALALLYVSSLEGEAQGWMAVILLPFAFCIIFTAFLIWALFAARPRSWFGRAIRTILASIFGLSALGTSMSCTYYSVAHPEYARLFFPIGIFMGLAATAAVATIARDVRAVWSEEGEG